MLNRKEFKVLLTEWRNNFINENAEKELSPMDLRYIEMHKRDYKSLDENVIKKIYVATRNDEDIIKYSLGYTQEESWGDNLLNFLKEKLKINLKNELHSSVFDRHVLAMMHEYSEMCKSYIDRSYSLSEAIQEFLYTLLNKLYKIQKEHEQAASK
jgi:hypothetical protein